MLPALQSATFFDQGMLKSVLENVISMALLMLVLVLGFLRGKMLEWIYQHVQRTISDEEQHLRPETTTGHNRINESMVDLLVEMNAMRISLFQFKNGDSFSLANHNWKLACTHEALRTGEKPIHRDNACLLVSSMSDMIAPMLDPSVVVRGATRVTGCAARLEDCPLSNHGMRRVIRFETALMPVTLARVLAEEQKASLTYTVNLIHPQKQVVIGFMAIRFDHGDGETMFRIEELLCQACRTAERAEFFLTSGYGGTPKKTFWSMLTGKRETDPDSP